MSQHENETKSDSIEVLQKRYQSLSDKKLVAETQRDHAQKRLDELMNRAREEFGVDSLEQLKKMLSDMKSKNEKAREIYEKNLDQIEGKLAQVDKEFEAAESEIEGIGS